MSTTVTTVGPGIASQTTTVLNPAGAAPAEQPSSGPTFGGGSSAPSAPPVPSTGPTFGGGANAPTQPAPPTVAPTLPGSAAPSPGYNNTYYRDTTTVVGGTPGSVNTCHTVISTVGKYNLSFEWASLCLLNNYADKGENAAHYAQANKFGEGATWARCAETCSTESIPGPQITDEVDCWVSGPSTGDKGCSDFTVGDGKFLRTGIRSLIADALFGWRVAASSATPWARVLFGGILTCFRECGILLNSVATRAIQLRGKYIVGIDLSTAETQSAIRLAPGQRMTFEPTDQISWSWLDGKLRVQNGTLNVLEIDTTTGDIYKHGVKVL